MHSSTKIVIDGLVTKAENERRCITCPDGPLRRELSRLLHQGELVSPWRGMFASSDQWNQLKPTERTRRIVRTLAQKRPNWTFCHLTAALMHGLEVGYRDLQPLHVAIGTNCWTKSTTSVQRHMIGNVQTCMADGVCVTDFKRTVLDCLIELDFKRGLAIADSALRVSGMTKTELVTYIKSRKDVLGWELALDAASWANPLAANGGESVARATLIEQGFMIPKLQVKIPDVIDGGEPYYADYLWDLPDGTRVAGELDGLDKYLDPQMTGGKSIARVMSAERRRESRLGAANLRVMRFSYDEVEDVERFSRILTAYGIPRGTARPRGRAR